MLFKYASVATIALLSYTLALPSPQTQDPEEAQPFVGGHCGVHIKQDREEQFGGPDDAYFRMTMKDGSGADVGEDCSTYTSGTVSEDFPGTLACQRGDFPAAVECEITPDAASWTCSYPSLEGIYEFGFDGTEGHGCSVGKVDGDTGTQDFDCGFNC